MEAREAIQVLTATVCRCQRGDRLNRALQSQYETEAVKVLTEHISTTMLIEIEVQELLGLARKPGAKPLAGSHAGLIAEAIEAYGSVSMKGLDEAVKKP